VKEVGFHSTILPHGDFDTKAAQTRRIFVRSLDRVLARTVTYALVGLDSRRVEVEAHLQSGVPGLAIVGLADRACQEAKERVRSGIRSAELDWPRFRITVNLAPAGLRKEGSGFDLPIALSILAASGQVPHERLAEHAVVGELALDGRVRPVAGALAVAEGARRAGLTRILCAAESTPEASLAGVEPVPIRHLAEATAYLRGERDPAPYVVGNGRPSRSTPLDLADVRGQERARRALELAAAGGHNLLLSGPPGTGKTMLGRRLPGILPPLGEEEALEVTRIHSVAGLLEPGRPLVTDPPFRAPHHSASSAAIVGGGRGPRPGEASLAHRGVLLLDELPEFYRPALEALRQPLEDGVIAIARAEGQAVFPARFQLVATMNLGPCGARGDPAAECSCSAQRLASFRDKLSRALLDRFDLVVTVPRPRAAELEGGPSEPSAPVRERVVAARERLTERAPAPTPAAETLLGRAVEQLPLSARGRARVARVSQTVAALAESEAVSPEHVAEALAYRSRLEAGA
jgi:magnesium chelatase family protein